MRKYIVVALLLVAAGLGISFLLLPNSTDVQLAQMRDQQAIDLGNIDLEAEYHQGRRTLLIIDALAKKRLGEGRNDEALRLWEEYVTTNPTDTAGRKKLAEYYQAAGRQADYNAQLEAIANAEPTEENLLVLAAVCNSDKNYPKQVDALKRLVDVTKGKKPNYYADLATIQVVVGDKDGALATLAELAEKHPDYTNYAITRIKVAIFTEQGKTDDAYAVAKAWVDAAPTPTVPTVVPPSVTPVASVSAPPMPGNQSAIELADLADILHYGGHAEKAIELIAPHVAWLDTSSQLAVSYVNAHITAGRTDEAYNLLAGLEAKGQMVPALYIPYLQLALKKNDLPAAEGIADRLDVAPFNEEQGLNIIEVARLGNAPTVLAKLQVRFGDTAYLTDKPVLAAVLSILGNARDQDAKIELALNKELSSLQRLRLAEACARAKKTACFDAILARYPAIDQQTTPQTVEYAQLYIIAERPNDILNALTLAAARPQAHPDTVFSHMRVAAAAGRKDLTVAWLEKNAATTPVQKLQDLFFLANDRKHTDVSIDIAERLYARDPSPMNRDILVAAYVGGGDYAKALPLVRAQIAEGTTDDSMYVAALQQAARKDADARKELVGYAEQQLKLGKGDERAQLNYTYVLINNGQREAAMPFVNTYAKERGGEWRRIQAQVTLKPGKGSAYSHLSREARVAMAANPKMSDDNKRQIAFSLLNDGHKDDAATVFKHIAANKGPESKEVKDLLYIWGGKLNAAQLAWVQGRAAQANAYDKEKWAELINAYGDDKAVVAYVGQSPEALYSAALRQRYFRMMAQTGDRQYFDQSMRNWVAQTSDVPALLDYANTAMAFSYREAALNAYRRVEQLDPGNAKAVDSMAQLTFGKGKFSEAAPLIERAIATNQTRPEADVDPAQAHYLKAEMLKKGGNLAAARQEYAVVLQYAQANPSQEPTKLARLYLAMFNSGQHQQAMQGFEQLLAAHPDDKGLLADYMSALIEFKYYDDATRVANQYDKSSPYYGRGASMTGDSQHVSAVERLSDGREMKISFSQPTEGKSPVNLAQAQQLAWVERAEVGYDSLTVSAKPGYIVRFVPTSSEQFAVISVPVDQVSPQVQAQREQDLRLQLLYARIEQETGQQERARQRLATLQQYYPQDSQLLATRASFEGASGNRGEAIELVKAAQFYNPDNEDLARMQRDLTYVARSSNGPSAQYVKLDGEYRSYGEHDEYITTLSGMAAVGGNNEIGFVVQNDSIHPDGILVPSSGAATDDSAARQQVELQLGHYFDNGSRLQGSLFTDSGGQVGAGAYYAFSHAAGRTELLGEYHKPYWDYATAVYAYANRDRVGFRHFAQLSENNSLGVEASANNYNIKFADDQVQTGLFRVSLSHQLQKKTADQPYLGVGYGFDGEYKMGSEHETRTGVNGLYKPFDWIDREVHFFSAMYQDDLTPTTHATLVAGYAFDRLNQDGPAVEARVTEDLTQQLELGVRGRYGFQAQQNNNDAVNVGAHLMYKF